ARGSLSTDGGRLDRRALVGLREHGQGAPGGTRDVADLVSGAEEGVADLDRSGHGMREHQDSLVFIERVEKEIACSQAQVKSSIVHRGSLPSGTPNEAQGPRRYARTRDTGEHRVTSTVPPSRSISRSRRLHQDRALDEVHVLDGLTEQRQLQEVQDRSMRAVHDDASALTECPRRMDEGVEP